MTDELDKFRPLDMTLDERLDEYLEWVNDNFDKALVTDAKSEIERLRAELAAVTEERDRLREALRHFAECYEMPGVRIDELIHSGHLKKAYDALNK
jgi:hypothetical protein